MKRRIFLYNAVVVTIALIGLLLVSGLVIRRVSDYYMQRPPVVDGSAEQAQTVLEDWT